MKKRASRNCRQRWLVKALQLFGVNFPVMCAALQDWPRYWRTYRQYRRLAHDTGEEIPLGRIYPCLGEHGAASGVAKGAYFHQDLWVARRICERRPEHHVDVGSRVDGFVAHVAAFRHIEVLDIRPMQENIANITFTQCDLMAHVPPKLVDYCDSLSCLHALEHFGLGRYGDPLCPDGYKRGFANMDRMLRPGGRFYLSVPIGVARVEFNCQRVFSIRAVAALVAERYTIDCFSYVDDAGNFHPEVSLASGEAARNFGSECGCGIFELVKH